MSFYIRILVQVSLTILMFVLFNLGMDYIEFYEGLNPWIAFPLSFIILCYVLYTLVQDYNELQYDYWVDQCGDDHPPHPDAQ